MEALLIYNPHAGGSAEDEAANLQTELSDLGYEPVYRATQSEDDLDRILPQAKGIVVVVGGDGTLRAVTTRMSEEHRVPIALLPNGTANNVGRTLGIEGSPIEILRGLKDAKRVPVDVGRLVLPWGETRFLEGAGMGLFAEALASYKPEDGKSFLRGCKTLVDLLSDLPSRHVKMRLDGREEEGEYILVEAMNMGAIGPRMQLAPDANPGDGLLDILRIKASERESYLTYLNSLLSGELASLESVETSKAKTLELFWDGFPIHQDASYFDGSGKMESLTDTWVKIELQEKFLEFLVPINQTTEKEN